MAWGKTPQEKPHRAPQTRRRAAAIINVRFPAASGRPFRPGTATAGPRERAGDREEQLRTIAAAAMPAEDRAGSQRRAIRHHVLAIAAPLVAGVAAAIALIALYVGLVSWAQGPAHARELLWDDRYFAGAIALGFGLQVALYTHIRIAASRAAVAAATGVTAAGTGTSTAAMVACCAHHVADALPLLGLSAAAVFLSDYRTPVMSIGLATNALGVAMLARLALRQRTAMRACRVERSAAP